jgi:hypothetical protein
MSYRKTHKSFDKRIIFFKKHFPIIRRAVKFSFAIMVMPFFLNTAANSSLAHQEAIALVLKTKAGLLSTFGNSLSILSENHLEAPSIDGKAKTKSRKLSMSDAKTFSSTERRTTSCPNSKMLSQGRRNKCGITGARKIYDKYSHT